MKCCLFQYQLLFSTLPRIKVMTCAGSGAPNTELPATMQFAPADEAASIVEGPKPPSTCITIAHTNDKLTLKKSLVLNHVLTT